MDEQKGQISNLLEDGWFFGNTLRTRSKTLKTMLRCNSDPCPCSGTNDDRNGSEISSNALNRAPSLPVSLDKNTKYEIVEEGDDNDDDDYEPRMGDLIRQAMPMPSRRLDRTPSLPPLRRGSDASSIVLNVENSRIYGKVLVDSSSLLQEKGPNHVAMVKLSRRASIDSSMVLPPKYTSKSTKQSGSNSKKKTPKKLEQSNMKTIPEIHQPKIETINSKSNSQKSFSDSETDELQRLKDLNFLFGNKNISPNVTQKLPTLQRRASLDSAQPEISKVRRPPYISEAWQKPLVPKWGDQKASSSQQDMKAQIKFWARAVASNVRQEC